jgi:hypothetical protein
MNPNKLRIGILAAQYQEALERGDSEASLAIWEQAASDPALEEALHEVHEGLLEDAERAEQAAVVEAVTAAAEEHLTSGEVIRPAAPITVADVAGELHRHTPDRLSAEAHALNKRLQSSTLPIPEEPRYSKLKAWAESQFGPAPEEYWIAFHKAAVKLEFRRAATAEYVLAARSVRKPENPS